jgi:hypothetical protein
MIDDRQNLSETEFNSPPPAHFDESASANAQPVEPIPASRAAGWIQRARKAQPLVSLKTRALTLVIVGGLAIGTLGGTMLVNERSSLPNEQPVVQEPTTETTATQDAVKESVSSEEAAALDAAAIALQRADQTSARSRRRRNPAPVKRAPRAYRVAVIR